MKKLITASLLSLCAATAYADPIYIDVGTDYNSADNAQSVNTTSTGWFDELQVTYASSTTFTDANGDGFLSIGDTFTSNGGMALGTTFGDFNDSHATSLNGGFFPGTNGFGDNPIVNDWNLTFGINSLSGVVTAQGLVYSSAVVDLYFYEYAGILPAGQDISGDLVKLFDLNIAFGAETGNSTVFFGNVGNFSGNTVNGVPASDVFNVAYGAGSKTFGEAAALPGGVRFKISQDTEGNLLGAQYAQAGGTLDITGQHEASIEFNVPEPASIAILGLGLLGLAGASRRRQA